MATLDRWRTYLTVPKTLVFSNLKLIGRDHAPTIIDGSGEVRILSLTRISAGFSPLAPKPVTEIKGTRPKSRSKTPARTVGGSFQLERRDLGFISIEVGENAAINPQPIPRTHR